MQERQVQSLGLKDPLEEEMATIPVFLPGKPHRQRNLVGSRVPKESETIEHIDMHTHTHTHKGEIQICFAEIIVTVYGGTQTKLQISSTVPFLPPQSVNFP